MARARRRPRHDFTLLAITTYLIHESTNPQNVPLDRQLFCLPLKTKGGEASPARAVLMRQEVVLGNLLRYRKTTSKENQE